MLSWRGHINVVPVATLQISAQVYRRCFQLQCLVAQVTDHFGTLPIILLETLSVVLLLLFLT
jgi:hypothetical protein